MGRFTKTFVERCFVKLQVFVSDEEIVKVEDITCHFQAVACGFENLGYVRGRIAWRRVGNKLGLLQEGNYLGDSLLDGQLLHRARLERDQFFAIEAGRCFVHSRQRKVPQHFIAAELFGLVVKRPAQEQ